MKPEAYTINEAMKKLKRAQTCYDSMDMFRLSYESKEEICEDLQTAFVEFAELVRSATRD